MAFDRHILEQALGHAVRYRETVDARPPRANVAGSDLLAAFDAPTPERGERAEEVISALVHAAEPGLGGSTGRRFFGWVIGASDPTGVAADILTSAWGQNAGNPACSPAAAAAEEIAGRWLTDLLRLPPQCSVGFVTGATMANFTGLAAARNALLQREGWDVEADGLQGAPHVRILMGREAHVTVLSALRYLGFGSRPEWVGTDDQGRMDPNALRDVLCSRSGPAIVIAQAGQINTGAFDPFVPIADVCEAYGAWLHVDGAFGLWARVASDFDALTHGLERANSWAVDGHKWLQLPYDSGFAIVRDTQAHRRAMGASASYLPSNSALLDPSSFAPELSRRARGFAAWAVIRRHGRQGIAAMVRGHCRLARRLADRLSRESGIEVMNDVVLNQVLVRFGDDDEATRGAIEQLQADNVCFAGGAAWRGQWCLRLSIISAPLTEADIDRLAQAILDAWRAASTASLSTQASNAQVSS